MGVTTGIVYDSGSLFCTALMQDSQSAETIVAKDLVKKAATEDLVYAVPGSPMVAEKTVVLLREYCQQDNIKLDIQPGNSQEYLRNDSTVLLNRGVTPMDNRADLIIRDKIGEVLGAVTGL